MSVTRPFTMPARLLRDFSGQVAISIAASAVAAAFFALPGSLLPGPARTEPVATALAWSAPMTRDGKFATRHDAQVQQARFETTSGPATPAALAMPLAIEWPALAPPAEIAVATATTRPATQPPRVAHVDIPPVRRIAMADRARAEPASKPLVVASVALSDDGDQPRPPGLIGSVVSQPAARAAGLVTGAVAAVGAAGSWTVAQAASLLPSW